MIEYIKHSSACTFTIYDDENSTNQLFRFTGYGADCSSPTSLMEGSAISNGDLIIKSNTYDTCPYIKLEGGDNASIFVDATKEFIISSCTDEEWLKVNSSGLYFKGTPLDISCPTSGDLPFTLFRDCDTQDEQGFLFIADAIKTSFFYGGDDTGDVLKIRANSTDTYPSITLDGDANIYLDIDNDDNIMFRKSGSQFFLFDHSGITSVMYGGADTGDALRLQANSIDSYPYILMEGDDYMELRTTNDIYFYEQTEQMFRFSLAGAVSTIYGSDDTSDDLHIRANTSDSSPSMTFEGNSVPTHAAINHHCNQSKNFVLELRTSDPSSPTCTGMIWLRTDLV